ncbi:efflux RND transporter periplasmic adaptor subunit [uncultured Desulfosarcina sp.]|uniref:efflux RND transporter periplasmic adaptor subunit n=1 Tax=uncultured Desulfosarcina sp. TaxID=218289 RepID=UPI0029C8F825|nr:efflux RND transporter periplasmic adaptor subunit [uncultured Desulfosarcina sp.]
MNLKMWLAAVSFFVLLTVGCQNQKQEAPAPRTPEVATTTVQPQPIMLTFELPGRISAYRVAEIRPQVSGLIQKRRFVEGADVKAGDMLYQIDPASFQAALNNADAALGRSEANLPAIQSRTDRYLELLADKAVSQQDYDDAAAALKQAEADVRYWKAAVETARINLAYTRITAPISGRIGRSNVTEGAIVTAYQPVALATIQQLDPIYVDVPQSTTDLLRLKRRLEDGRLNQASKNQQAVTLVMEEGPAYPLQGSLQFRDVTVDPTTGSVILRAVFPNPQGILLPGMFVRAVMKEGVNEAAILIPQQAVSRDPKGNPTALIVDAADTVQQRMLVLDRAIGDQWLVTSGLGRGDRVIVEGIQKVRPGAAVKVVALESAAPAGEAKSVAPVDQQSN